MGSGYDYVRRKAAELAQLRLRQFQSRVSQQSQNNSVVCGTISNDGKQLTTTDGRVYKTHFEGFPSKGFICGILLDQNTVLIKNSRRRILTVDSVPTGDGLLLMNSGTSWWVTRIKKPTVHYAIPLGVLNPADIVQVMFSPNGKHILVGAQKSISGSTSYATDGIQLDWIVHQNFILNTSTLTVDSTTTTGSQTIKAGDLGESADPAPDATDPASGFSFTSTGTFADGSTETADYEDQTANILAACPSALTRSSFLVEGSYVFTNASDNSPVVDFVGRFRATGFRLFAFTVSRYDLELTTPPSSTIINYTHSPVNCSSVNWTIDGSPLTSSPYLLNWVHGAGSIPGTDPHDYFVPASAARFIYDTLSRIQKFGIFFANLIPSLSINGLETGDNKANSPYWVPYTTLGGSYVSQSGAVKLDNTNTSTGQNLSLQYGNFPPMVAFHKIGGATAAQYVDNISGDFPFYSPYLTLITTNPAGFPYKVFTDTLQFFAVDPPFVGDTYVKSLDSAKFIAAKISGSDVTLDLWTKPSTSLVKTKSISGTLGSGTVVDWALV